MISVVRRASCGVLFSLCLGIAPLLTVSAMQTASAQTVSAIVEIGPKRSNHPDDPDAASGGRVNGIAVDPADDRVMYAASEWGGLFKSTDGGKTWNHLLGHVPQATWDVAVDPANPSRVYATSLYDGRTDSIAGISVSVNGGATWSKPVTATPPAGMCANPEDREQPHAFGIAIDPAQPAHVFIGTNCGLAMSEDSGSTWRFIDPTPGDPADYVWDIVVHHGGIIDLCGDDGHQRSVDGGLTWTSVIPGAVPLPGGRCSIAVSPDEPHVLFAVVGVDIFESENGGQTWALSYANPNQQGRIPFIATNKRAGSGYDLWFGDVSLWRRGCKTPSPPVPGGPPRCAGSWSAGFTRQSGGHDDVGDLAFATAGPDACPLLFSSDGGVYFNTKTTSPDCHTPLWQQPDRTPQAVWNFDMVGTKNRATGKVSLYFGNQDTGTFGTTDAGAAEPNWNNEHCCDGFSMAAEATRVLSTVCCWGGLRSTRLFLSQPGLTQGTEISTYPPGDLRAWDQLDSITNFGPDDYVIVTTNGVYVTKNIGASPIVWTRLGGSASPANPCAVQVSFRGTTPIFYTLSSASNVEPCNGDNGRSLYRYEGSSPAGAWTQVVLPSGGQFGVYAVDPNDPNRIIAAALTGGTPKMMMTTDGGATWADLPELDSLMTGGGQFRYRATNGPSRFTGFNPYLQPTLLAFDPENPDVIVAGAADAGVFMSIDSGVTWRLLTDPINPAGSGVPHIPRPRYAFFDHLEGNRLWLFLGTIGRGQWRIELEGVPKAERHTLTSGLLFDTGSATIKAAAEAELMDIAGEIRARQTALVYVDGHTDSVGSEASNQLLSERRANAVRSWLVTRGGVDGLLVQARGFGELKPVATNDTAAGRASNRRVEIIVISNAVSAGAPR